MTGARNLAVSKYHEIEDCDPLPEWMRVAMRRVICANAVGVTLAEQVADAELLMWALGVFPGQDEVVAQ